MYVDTEALEKFRCLLVFLCTVFLSAFFQLLKLLLVSEEEVTYCIEKADTENKMLRFLKGKYTNRLTRHNYFFVL